MNIQDWFMANMPGEEMYWCQSTKNQIMWWRDSLMSPFYSDLMKGVPFEDIRNRPQVVGSHTSKSCKLPVVKLPIDDDNYMIMRDNFYDVKVSVSLNHPVCPFLEFPYGLITDGISKPISRCYCEGMSDDMVFPSWDERFQELDDQRMSFTVAVRTRPDLHTMMWFMRHYMDLHHTFADSFRKEENDPAQADA